jgi:hypothetical protein
VATPSLRNVAAEQCAGSGDDSDKPHRCGVGFLAGRVKKWRGGVGGVALEEEGSIELCHPIEPEKL